MRSGSLERRRHTRCRQRAFFVRAAFTSIPSALFLLPGGPSRFARGLLGLLSRLPWASPHAWSPELGRLRIYSHPMSQGCVFFSLALFFQHRFSLCSGAILAHCNLHLPGSRDSSLGSRVPGIIGVRQYAWIVFVFLVEMGFRHIGQAGLELLMTSGDPPALASQSAGIIGMSHRAQPVCFKVSET